MPLTIQLLRLVMELRYTLSCADGVAAALGVSCELTPRYNVAAGQHAPVVRNADAGRELAMMRWGLLPRWRGHGGKRGALVHMAPLEAVAGTPLLRDAFKKQRCLIVADGCFAWRDLKQPVWFHPDPPRPIAYAGVWAIHDDDGVASFAMIVGGPHVTRVTHPMPILVDAEAYDAWLDPSVPSARAESLLGEPPLEGWRADAVSTWMSSATHDDPRCITPLGPPGQGELFG